MSARRTGGPETKGPVESHRWPERLSARVVSPEPVLVHGYALDSDLAVHYGFMDLCFLAFTGTLPPSAGARALFESALLIAAPISVAEAPAHAGLLARLCGASESASVAAGSVVLSEQAQYHLELMGPLLDALAAGASLLVPEPLQALSQREVESLAHWRPRLPAALRPLFDQRASRLTLAVAVLSLAGVPRQGALSAALCWARVPLMSAEILAQPPLDFGGYPMDKPEFVYEETER